MYWPPYILVASISILVCLFAYQRSNPHKVPILGGCSGSVITIALIRIVFQCLLFSTLHEYSLGESHVISLWLPAAIFCGVSLDMGDQLLLLYARFLLKGKVPLTDETFRRVTQDLRGSYILRNFLSLEDYFVERIAKKKRGQLFEIIPHKELKKNVNILFEVLKRSREFKKEEAWILRTKLFSKKFYLLIENLDWNVAIKKIEDLADVGAKHIAIINTLSRARFRETIERFGNVIQYFKDD